MPFIPTVLSAVARQKSAWNKPGAPPMKITHYLYDAFLLEADGAKVAIDPGQNLWIRKPESLIPESEWPSVTHLATVCSRGS